MPVLRARRELQSSRKATSSLWERKRASWPGGPHPAALMTGSSQGTRWTGSWPQRVPGSPGTPAGAGTPTTEMVLPGGSKSKCLLISWLQSPSVVILDPTLCDPMDHTVHGILRARTLEWVAFPFFRESSQLRDQTLLLLGIKNLPAIARGPRRHRFNPWVRNIPWIN